MKCFGLQKLNEVGSKEKYRVEVSNRIAALEDLDGEIENNTIWDDWREYQNSNQRKSRLL
jgi:hypothetical protein